jgi:hypothetical protein
MGRIVVDYLLGNRPFLKCLRQRISHGQGENTFFDSLTVVLHMAPINVHEFGSTSLTDEVFKPFNKTAPWAFAFALQLCEVDFSTTLLIGAPGLDL